MGKKKKSGKKKVHHVKRKYSLRNLNEILLEMDQKTEAGESLSDYDVKLRTTIQQTIDLIMDNRKLDLSMDSERHLDQALMMKGVAMQKEGVDEPDIVKYLSAIGSSYLLFEQINLLTSFSVIGDIYYNAEESDNLMIKAHMYLSPNNVVFDPYEAMERVADTCFVFKDIKPSLMGIKTADPDEVVRGLGVNLDPYRDIFVNEMLEAL